MDKIYLSNNDQEGVFAPSERYEEKTVEETEGVNTAPNNYNGEKQVRKERYYASTIAPARRINTFSTTPDLAENEYLASNLTQVVYLIAGITNLLLGVRFLFKLLGASPVPVVQGIYNITQPLVSPFTGVFRQADLPGNGLFEPASLLSIVAVTIGAMLVVGLIRSFSSTRI